jgi:hypothetical protein
MSRAVWGGRLEKWNLERAIAAKARRPRGKRIHSSTLLQKKLRQRRLGCGTPAISRASVGAGRQRGLHGATYMWRGRTSNGRVRVCAKTEPLSPTRTIPDALTLSCPQLKSDDRHTKVKRPQRAYLDRRISVNWSTYRPCSPTLTSGKRKYTPGRP